MTEITTDKLLKAINSPFRRNILYIVYKKGRIKYSDLMKEMRLDPKSKSGWFAYHLQILTDALLLTREEENRYIYYSLTELGEKTVKFLKEASVDIPVTSTIVSLFGNLSTLNLVEASWSIIFFTFGILFLTYHLMASNLFFNNVLVGSVLLIAFFLIEVHLFTKVRSISFFLFLNIYWIFLKPPKWKLLGLIIAFGVASFFAFVSFVETNSAIFLAFVLTFMMLAVLTTIFVVMES
ncbi:MAG: winged helix-turn-helix domain-containing protein [Candidatus Asgardarchaeia archaeon]